MEIRLMQIADFPQLAALWEPNHMVADFESVQRVLARNPDTCFVIEEEGQVIGGALGLYDGRRGVLQSLAVLPDYRGRGYGTSLIKTVIDALKRVGAKRIRLFVYKDNADAIRLYERLGFSIYEGVYYMGLDMD